MMRRVSLVLFATVALAAIPARAGIEPPIFTTNLTTYSCRELLALEEARQNLALMYFGGYVDGQKSAVQLDAKAKGDVIDKVMEHCRRDAAASVLEAFRRFTP
jgi:HdeA/HdeB family